MRPDSRCCGERERTRRDPRSAHTATKASATPIQGPTGQGTALFQGRTINLAQGWGSAHACEVPAQGETQCFATIAQMAKAMGTAMPTATTTGSSGATGSTGGTPSSGTTAASPDAVRLGGHAVAGSLAPRTSGCSNGGLLYLYSDIDFEGNVLGIDSVDTWIDLSALGFANVMSSWINNASCVAYGEHTLGGSYLTMPGYDSNTWVGNTWNDKVAWVYMQQ